MAFEILLQDEWLCAINKPPGIMVHRSKIGSDREFVLQKLRDQLDRHVWPVHRLDRATSGLLLFALDSETAKRVGQAFMDRRVDKGYLAVVRGWTDEAGAIDHPLARDKGAEPRAAMTRYERLATCELPIPISGFETARYSLVEASPTTGRRHQIRRHFKHVSHHLIGDTTYGDGRHNRLFRQHLDCHRMLLHASRLAFEHPWESRRIDLAAPLESEFAEVVEAIFGWPEEGAGVRGQGSGGKPV